MTKLTVTRDVYAAEIMDAWTHRKRNALVFPASSSAFAKLLKRKVRGRSARTPRFFGEAFVATRNPHREAYYGSFKWLTNRRFLSGSTFSNRDQEDMRLALHRHFGVDALAKLQAAADLLRNRFKKTLTGKAPTAPDLWLVEPNGRHRFIEVKLPGDSMAPHQLAGMAAIEYALGAKGVSVEVMQLQSDYAIFNEFLGSLHSQKT